MRPRTRLFALTTILFAVLLALPVCAQTADTWSDDPPVSRWKSAGYHALVVPANAVYMPAKVSYMVMGVVSGAGTLVLGDRNYAKWILRVAFGGNYLLTPGMLEGARPINFSGPAKFEQVAGATEQKPKERAAPAAAVPQARPAASRPVGTSKKSRAARRWWHIW